jgi:pimeloyl-ACP methyl ester carboxylesterase
MLLKNSFIMKQKLVTIFLSYNILLLLFNPSFGQTTIPKTDTIQVVVDSHNISLYTSGTGKYTVILEAGGASNHKCWNKVFPEIAKLTRVISYDRPGYLNSEICTKQRDAITVAKELKTALEKSNFPPPYLIAGWSLGGAFARAFCGLYPESVAGLILIDPTPEEVYPRIEKEYPELLADDSVYMKELLASNDRPGERAENIVFDISMLQAKNSDTKHTTPTILLIATEGKAPGKSENDPNNPMNKLWVEELVKWAAKRPNVQYSIIKNCGHHIAKQRPEMVMQAISEMLNKRK